VEEGGGWDETCREVVADREVMSGSLGEEVGRSWLLVLLLLFLQFLLSGFQSVALSISFSLFNLSNVILLPIQDNSLSLRCCLLECKLRA